MCHLLLFMKTPNVNAMSEMKAGFVISYVVDFLLFVQWIAVLICWRKQKNIAVFA